MHDAKAIRKHTAQHDLFNRIHSIAADGAFVKRVAEGWYVGRFEVVPNQRCGTWYCDPSSSSTVYAYFKSTDGHTNNWNFNLRRSNLPLAQIAEDKGGLILVDSTRRGKRMPDALSKTVPIWCAVINIALQLRREDEGGKVDGWDTTLYLPPNIVSPSEQAQIQALLPSWAAALETSTLPLPSLTKPLRPFFVHPGTTSPPQIPSDPPYTPIICASASRWVGAGGDDVPSVTSIGKRTVGYEYVPGAGDDDELWARGLKPALYHARRNELLESDRDDLADLVDEIVASGKELSLEGLKISDSTVSSHVIGVPDSTSPLAVDIGPPTIECAPWSHTAATSVYIVEIDKLAKDASTIIALGTAGDMILIAVPDPRTDGNRYRKVLAELVTALRPKLDAKKVVIRAARRQDLDAAVKAAATLPQGVELSTMTHPLTPAELVSARKAIIPITLALTCSLRYASTEIDKSVIADELHHLVSLWPDGNPPRAALKRVNEVLISRDR